ncbi:F0F1 ATP synthase subunit epsilon [Furfurilactobacillus sp. WILCCON 0119]|uniref:F0F1 ATP synthase subunit epsilon n=1 Tax=Furfurilactobacillus entadae TaxID=2922307 RepID=UPI0035EB9EC8
MAEPQLTVTIVTPDGTCYENDQATMFVAKTTNGEIGILPNHVPLIAALEIDEIRVKHDSSDEDEIAVNGGFVEFSDNVATIVADSAEQQSDIDITRAESARTRAQNAIQHAQQVHDTAELRRAEVALRRAINRINVGSHNRNR